MTIGEKKKIYSKLKQLQSIADELWVPLDAEVTKSKILDRVAIITSSIAATAGLLADVFEEEVMADENRWRMEQEFKKLYDSEINRLKPPPQPTKEEEEDYGDDIEEPGGIPPGA
jgi:hypothetical protein